MNDEIINDPTLQRDVTVECPKCGGADASGKRHGAVFFQPPTISDEHMTMIFVCCNPECICKWQG